MAKIQIRTGSEGPSWDPYSFTQITFTCTDGLEVVHHSGLGEWCMVDGMTVGRGEEAAPAFLSYAGLTPYQAQKAYHRIHQRCSLCGHKRGRWV